MSTKLLLDANLSWRLIKLLQEDFPGTEHVDSTRLEVPAKDREIWNHARQEGFVIVTNDDDFYEYAVMLEFPPYTVLLRMGNQSTAFILTTLQQHKQDIANLTKSRDIGLLEIF